MGLIRTHHLKVMASKSMKSAKALSSDPQVLCVSIARMFSTIRFAKLQRARSAPDHRSCAQHDSLTTRLIAIEEKINDRTCRAPGRAPRVAKAVSRVPHLRNPLPPHSRGAPSPHSSFDSSYTPNTYEPHGTARSCGTTVRSDLLATLSDLLATLSRLIPSGGWHYQETPVVLRRVPARTSG